MSRLIDCEKIRKPIYAEDDNITGIGMTYGEIEVYNAAIDEFWNRIKSAPTVDAVPVVRCKDCKWREDRDICPEPKPDKWFCADGERKENE